MSSVVQLLIPSLLALAALGCKRSQPPPPDIVVEADEPFECGGTRLDLWTAAFGASVAHGLAAEYPSTGMRMLVICEPSDNALIRYIAKSPTGSSIESDGEVRFNDAGEVVEIADRLGSMSIVKPYRVNHEVEAIRFGSTIALLQAGRITQIVPFGAIETSWKEPLAREKLDRMYSGPYPVRLPAGVEAALLPPPPSTCPVDTACTVDGRSVVCGRCDTAGRPLTAWGHVGPAVLPEDYYTYRYDDAGRVVERVYDAHGNGLVEDRTTFTYASDGSLLSQQTNSEVDPEQVQATYYRPDGSVERKLSQRGGHATSRMFDADGRMVEFLIDRDGDGTFDRKRTYDKDGSKGFDHANGAWQPRTLRTRVRRELQNE